MTRHTIVTWFSKSRMMLDTERETAKVDLRNQWASDREFSGNVKYSKNYALFSLIKSCLLPRRLSSKTREQTLSDINRMGIENRGFQQDHVPKSPWRYPFRRSQVPTIQRTISQDSTSTIASAANANAAAAIASTSTQSLRRETLSRMLPP